jgi:hypothetical protein
MMNDLKVLNLGANDSRDLGSSEVSGRSSRKRAT